MSQISGPGSINPPVRWTRRIFVIVSEHHRGCSTMQRLGSLGLGAFQTLSDRLRNDSVFNIQWPIRSYFPESGSGSVNTDPEVESAGGVGRISKRDLKHVLRNKLNTTT